MKENTKQLLGMGAALLSNLIFGFSFIFSKMALESAHPLIILSARFTIAFIALNILVIFKFVKLNFKGKKLGRLLVMSLAQPLFYFIFELYGLSLVSSALSGIIIALVPVWVILLSALFLNERPSTVQYICTAISLSGVIAISILSNDGGKNHIIGVFLLALAVISASVFNILSRSQSATFSPFERTYFMFLVGCIGFNIISLFTFGRNFALQISTAFSSGKFIIAVIYLAIVSSVAAFILYNYSTTVISAVRSSSFSNIITIVSVLAGIVVLGEPFSIIQMLLCIPIILGVWGVNQTKADIKNK